MMWGEGSLSPGGADEVKSILAGEDLVGASVLDIGSGAGGAALLMARDYGIAKVLGIDVVPELVKRSFSVGTLQRRYARIQISVATGLEDTRQNIVTPDIC